MSYITQLLTEEPLTLYSPINVKLTRAIWYKITMYKKLLWQVLYITHDSPSMEIIKIKEMSSDSHYVIGGK
jgi:hypothetical protein